MISCGKFRLDAKNLNWFINWQVSQLLQSNTYLHTILASQQLMLRVPEYRGPFYNSTCLDKMLNILSTRISFQVYCFMLLLLLWVAEIFGKLGDYRGRREAIVNLQISQIFLLEGLFCDHQGIPWLSC